MASVDLTVRGAGIFGLSIAWEAVRRGICVRVIDPGGVGAGSSGGVVGALAPHTPENWNAKKAFQLDSLLAAEGSWREVDATSGLASGYARLGRLQPLNDEGAVDLAQARARTSKDLWQGAASWSVIDADRVFGWAPQSATGKLVFDDLSARIDPLAACESLASAIRMRGGDIVDQGREVGPVIWATGIDGLRDLTKDLGTTIGSGVKGQAAVLHFDAGQSPQIFGDALHIVPHRGGTVSIGSTSERDYESPTATDAKIDDLISRASLVVPALHGARVIRRWAGVRPRAMTRAPILGEWPGRPGHFVANGGFKIGFGVAPKIASVMVDLVVDGIDRIPEEFRLVPPP